MIIIDNILLIGKITELLKRNKMLKQSPKNYKDLAKITGYTYGSIKTFMCNGKGSEEFVNCICKALGIER